MKTFLYLYLVDYFLSGTRLLATENFTSHESLSSSSRLFQALLSAQDISLLLLCKLVWVVTALRLG